MCGCEGIVDVDVGVAGEGSGKGLVVGLFTGSEAQVLPDGLRCRRAGSATTFLAPSPTGSSGQHPSRSRSSTRQAGHRHEAKTPGFGPFGPSEMRGQDHRPPRRWRAGWWEGSRRMARGHRRHRLARGQREHFESTGLKTRRP